MLETYNKYLEISDRPSLFRYEAKFPIPSFVLDKKLANLSTTDEAFSNINLWWHYGR